MPQVKQTTDKMINQAAILKMGWTKTMIAKFLPEPKLKQNPWYKEAAPIKLWRESDVLSIMETADFMTEMEKAAKRRAAKLNNEMEKAKKKEFTYDTSVICNNIMSDRTQMTIVCINGENAKIIEKAKTIPRDTLDDFWFQLSNTLEGLCYVHGVLIVQDAEPNRPLTYGLIANGKWWKAIPQKELSTLYDSLIQRGSNAYLSVNPEFFSRYA
ncbi:MAG: hypothetical protein ACI4TK_03670 [Agathobacter sp.]